MANAVRQVRVGSLGFGDLFRTYATRRWGKVYGHAPDVGTGVKIADKIADKLAAPLRFIHPDVWVEHVGN